MGRFFVILLFSLLIISPNLAYRQGTAGRDYPTYSHPPRTGFSCRGRADGYWADVEAGCAAFHVCEHQGRRKHSFVCAAGTLFSQDLKVCDHWYNVECGNREHEAEAASQHLDARRATPRPTTTTTTSTTTTTAAPVVYQQLPRLHYSTTPEPPQTYFDQDPFIDDGIAGRRTSNNNDGSLANDLATEDGIHSHKRTFWTRDETSPIGSASSSRSSLSHNSATFVSSPPDEPTPRPVISQTTVRPSNDDPQVSVKPVKRNHMNILESIVNYMVSGDEEPIEQQPITNATENRHNQTKANETQTTTEEYVPDVRNERWDIEDDVLPRPVYRPEDVRLHHEHPEDELGAIYTRARNQGSTEPPSADDGHPNPWLFPASTDDLTSTASPQQPSARLRARNQERTGNAFDFEMGTASTTESPPRSTQRRSHGAHAAEPEEAETKYTPEQLARAPYGVVDQTGYCRCPRSIDYL